MKPGPFRVLLIDDDEEDYILLRDIIARSEKVDVLPTLRLEWAATYDKALEALRLCSHDVYLVDYALGDRTGLELLRAASGEACMAPIIMLTGHDSYAVAMAAMELGAADYLVKGQLNLVMLERSIRYSIERTETLRTQQRLVHELSALQKATSSLLHTLDLSDMLGRILDAAREAIPVAEHSWMYLFQDAESSAPELSRMEFHDPRIRHIELSQPPTDGIAALRDGRTLVLLEGQEHQLLRFLLQEDERRSIRSAIIAPVVLHRDLFGGLALASSSLHAFPESTQALVRSLAAMATAATQNAVLYRQTQDQAMTDALTGQLNRRALFKTGEEEMRRADRFGHALSAIMFDIDRFKEVNDRFGHAAGDRVLQEVAERCRRAIRHVDVLGRYGGDEFVVLLPEADRKLAREIATRIRGAASLAPIRTEAGMVPVSLSMGVAEAGRDTAEVGELLQKADRALYQSKQAGRNIITVAGGR